MAGCFHILESLRQNAKLQNEQISDRGGSIVQVYRFTFISNKFVGREYLQSDLWTARKMRQVKERRENGKACYAG